MQLIINALKSITSIGTGFIPQTVDENQAMMAYFKNEYKGDWKSAKRVPEVGRIWDQSWPRVRAKSTGSWSRPGP